MHPAGVVGGVAESLHAIGGELRFLSRGDVAHPQVVVADERRALAIGRRQIGRRRAAPRRGHARCFAIAHRGAAAPSLWIAGEAFVAHAHENRPVGRVLERVEGQTVRIVLRTGGCRESSGEAGLVEGARSRSARGIDGDELEAGGRCDAIPEAIVRPPGGTHASAVDERHGVRRELPFRARIVSGGDGALLGCRGATQECDRCRRGDRSICGGR